MAEVANIEDRRLHIATAIGISLAVLVYIYLPAHGRLTEMMTELEKTFTEVKETSVKVSALKAEKKALEDDPLYLEKVIRTELRMIKPGEISNEYGVEWINRSRRSRLRN